MDLYDISLLCINNLSNVLFIKEHLFNPDSTKGSFIENFLRNQRSSNPIYKDIKGPYKQKENEEIILEGDLVNEEKVSEIISLLKSKTISNRNDRDDVSKRMAEIHVNRFIWISELNPSLTEILSKYPRYVDCVELVCAKS
jgi:hypothetical protein